jgi:putative protease
MNLRPPVLELLAPAKNAEQGMAAIDHGADAVYIGGPAFGARSSAGNTVEDITTLCTYAHRFNARVLVALNTILRDDELDAARKMAWQVYEAGADALILQDMGLLELELPPIELHASTQCDIRSPEKARFLDLVGFSQMVLARELNLDQIGKIAAATDASLEFFVHGALCVSYSGQCNISHAFSGRSANRGDCSQICRLPFSLKDADGRAVAESQHLLSLKDNDQTANLGPLIDAGIRSFKIEGRLKDLAYVKNITAHYRQALDRLIAERPGFRRSSAGRSEFTFTPKPEKTFNRGSTDYFVNDRQDDIAAFGSPKFVGEAVGRVRKVGAKIIVVETAVPLHNGDGLSWYRADGELAGARINTVELANGLATLHTNEALQGLAAGATLFRNLDHEFEKQVAKKTAERRLALAMHFAETTDGFALTLTDETGVSATANIVQPILPADNASRAEQVIREQLGKLGATMFTLASPEKDLTIDTDGPRFLPAGALNALRRDAVEALLLARQIAYRRPPRKPAAEPPATYPEAELTYLANVYNAKARRFYQKHGVRLIDASFEANQEKSQVSLMITKHCLRYSFNLCWKQVKGIKPEPMTLWQESADGKSRDPLTLKFDCKKCEMHVLGKLRGKRALILPIKAG